MKAIWLFLLIAVMPGVGYADVPPSPPEPNHTDEAVTLMVGAISTAGNVMAIANKTPAYWLGGLGIASGVTALVMRSQPDAEHENGLLSVGLIGVATGAIALRYRYVLNHSESTARLEPSWHRGRAGLAFVIDF